MYVSSFIHYVLGRKSYYPLFIFHRLADSRTGVFLRGEETDVEINCSNHLGAALPGTPTGDSVRRCQGVELLPLLHLLRRLTKRHRHRHRVHLKQNRAAYFFRIFLGGPATSRLTHLHFPGRTPHRSPRARRIAPWSRAIISRLSANDCSTAGACGKSSRGLPICEPEQCDRFG